MKKFIKKFHVVLIICVLMVCMTTPAFAVEYDADEFNVGDVISLYPGDTITPYDDPSNEGMYFTVLDGVGSHVGDDGNYNQDNIILNTFTSMYGDKQQIYFGKGSLYKAHAMSGFYAYSVEVCNTVIDEELKDSNGTTITYTPLILVGSPIPITYTISYDANGGTGQIDAHEWVYTERDKTLSNGEGFQYDGHKLVGWTLDKNGTESDAVVTAELGESLNLGPEENVARNIPFYATDPTIDGKADVTLYAVWEKVSTETPIVPGDTGIGEAVPETPATQVAPAPNNATTTPNTGDSSMIVVASLLLVISSALGIVSYKKIRN